MQPILRRLTSGPTASNEIIASGAAAAGLDTARADVPDEAAMSLIENIQRRPEPTGSLRATHKEFSTDGAGPLTRRCQQPAAPVELWPSWCKPCC
jgi:hypothetical protein